jgi:alkaline phosphatase D
MEMLSRRELLAIASRLGMAAVLQPLAPTRVFAQRTFSRDPFTLGVASGDPWHDNVILWTRLAPSPLDGGGMPPANVDVGWEIAHDDTFKTIAYRGTAIARPELGHAVHVEVAGLEPGRDYWYRFHAGKETSPIGRTRTAPAPGADVARLRFAVCGCNHYETGYFTGFRRIAEEHFDFVIHTGDYIYEDPPAEQTKRPGVVRQHHNDEPYSVTDYRNRYAQYKTDRDLMAAHASAPFIVTSDDHEVDNDYAGPYDEHDTPVEIFLLRRAAAYQAYYEAMPLRAATIPAGPNMLLYRRLQFGRLIDLDMLDTRQYRSRQACGRNLESNCPEAAARSRTMLGATQERWLFDQLQRSRATWTVLGQQVPTFMRDAVATNPTGRYSMDKWDGYTAARDRLYARLKEMKGTNPIVVSGDVHVHYGADLKIDFHDPRSPTVGTEFTNTSLSSGGDGTDVASVWERIRGGNPHIKYHSARRGYIACTATPQTLRADFKVLDKVTVRDLPIRTGGSLVVEAGRRGSSPA